jgi:hypothetical protein
VSSLARTVFLVLVAATFGAFFVAQRLKGAAPVVELRGTLYFSPNGDGRKDTTDLTLRMGQSEVVTVDLIDEAGQPVRRVATERLIHPSTVLRLSWDGRTDDGGRAPDGLYRVRVSLTRQGRSVIVPRLITLDTTPPHPRVISIKPGQVVGPTAPAMSIKVKGISRRRATRFRVLRTDLGAPQLVAEGSRPGGLRKWTWNGRSGGKPVPPGVYVVQVIVRDRAGNIGRTPAQVPPAPGDSPGPAGITVRSLAAQPPLRPVTAGEKAEFFVDARQRAYRWAVRRVGAKRPVRRGKIPAGEAKPLRVRAPRGTSGLYFLELQSGSARTSVPFIVQARDRADLLVVLPAITWLGTDPVDDPPLLDGIPDTLDRAGGGRVRWPRVFAAEDGLPNGLKREVTPLLRFLDRSSIRYDLTTDLDLALSENPRASDRKGVLLAGSERWVTRPLARRLRRYVADGGRLATFGTDTLRRGVTLRTNGAESTGELLRPTQPSQQDPFGATLEPLRRAKAPVAISQLAGDPAYGLFTGSDGTLDGFTAFEDSPPPEGGGAKLLAALGEPPAEPDPNAPADQPTPEERYALTATQPGDKGLVIRVGLPQWPQRLDDPEIAQVTLNIVDLLRGKKPHFRNPR